MKVLQKITVPQESVNDKYLTVVAMPFKTGDFVKQGDVIIELETSKAITTIEAAATGYVEYLCQLDEEVEVNKIIINIVEGKIETIPIATTTKLQTQNVLNNPKSEIIHTHETLFSMKAQALIIERKLDKSIFSNLDFVTENVVLDFLDPNRDNKSGSLESQTFKSPPKESNAFQNEDQFTLTKVNYSKRREIEYLTQVQSAGLVSVINIDVDIENLFESVNPSLKYFKDSILPLVIYECSRLLLKYPLFNSFYHNDNIVQCKEIHLGIAMDVEDGLKVVKIPQTNTLYLKEIEEQLFSLANKYIDKKLDSNDLSGSTFTITDLSSFGALSFTPLVSKNNSAILGISKIDKKLNRIILSLAFDHRVTEGKVATIFLQDLKDRLQSYAQLTAFKNNLDHIFCSKCMKTMDENISDLGFIKIVNRNGEDKYICDLCLLNF